MDISQLYKCNRNLSCRRCYCSAAGKTLTTVTAVTAGHSRRSKKWRKKWNMSQEDGLSPGCHLAPYFSPSLTQSAGKTNEILEAMSWGYSTLFSYQTLLSTPQILCRNDVFSWNIWTPPKAFEVELWQICYWHWQLQRCEHVSVRGLLEMINCFSLSQNRKKEGFRWMLCSFISTGKRHQHERTANIKDQ